MKIKTIYLKNEFIIIFHTSFSKISEYLYNFENNNQLWYFSKSLYLRKFKFH